MSYKRIFEVKDKKADKKDDKKSSVGDTINSVIKTNWSGSNDEQMKAVQMLKFLATSDDPKSNAFMKKLDTATSSMEKETK